MPCVCSRIKNHDIVSHTYRYVDCNGDVQTMTLTAGQRSDRMCLIMWLSSYATDYVEYFGNCTNGICPPVVYPKRSLRPGYSTPYCSTRRYEEVSCAAAEAMYKQVLTLRYGISNCCPDDDLKYIIQKELIDLKALENPDYICAVPTCGCGGKGSCGCSGNCGGNCGGGCGCNSTPRTCQS
jgi:hypothetical protein